MFWELFLFFSIVLNRFRRRGERRGLLSDMILGFKNVCNCNLEVIPCLKTLRPKQITRTQEKLLDKKHYVTQNEYYSR